MEYEALRKREAEGKKRLKKIGPLIPKILKTHGIISRQELTKFILEQCPEFGGAETDEIRSDINAEIWRLVHNGTVTLTSDRRLSAA